MRVLLQGIWPCLRDNTAARKPGDIVFRSSPGATYTKSTASLLSSNKSSAGQHPPRRGFLIGVVYGLQHFLEEKQKRHETKSRTAPVRRPASWPKLERASTRQVGDEEGVNPRNFCSN
ncbi:hypothetical protein E1B28_006203 [Marasmius oreades]|uniref:Uncharacterized protein n=1 Tax=Marasmius oreades TaxID=181124 RepID=A0A9P7UVD0_9AGAR|nr:uncharacterized protein E1B28_006203 [Marasmius oreades]KAG7095463.1 hypothetical protein E1B28_006203 [Marasmius oreades]